MKYIKIMISLALFCAFTSVYSQTKEEKETIKKESNIQELNRLAKYLSEEYKRKKEHALTYAKENGIPFFKEENGAYMELMEVTDDGNPLYYTTFNANAAITSRANHLNTGGDLGLDINGQGLIAHVWDAGPVSILHPEFESRIMIGDGHTVLTNPGSKHATHVTGTIVAKGIVPEAQGMAKQGSAITNVWDNDLAEIAIAATDGMLFSNHSYGHPTTISRTGAYNNTSKYLDDILYNAPYYLMVVAAGNSGTTTFPLPLEGNPNYDKLFPMATTKNNLAIGATNDAIIDDNGNLISVTMADFSSQGPTDDLRIKPDIVANGVNLYSTEVPWVTDKYSNKSGTSMATPSVTGSLMLLQQYYSVLNSSFMRAATLKGLALHTADDIEVPGPDAIAGWGLINTLEAARTIKNEGISSIIEENTLTSGDSYSITVTSNGVDPLMASISWTDPSGTPNNTIVNLTTPVLVNDLDIRITQGASSYEPYKLTSVSTNAMGDNTVDPYERIDIDGAAGVYTITVTHKGTLTSPSGLDEQNYSLIISGISLPEAVCVSDISITTDVLSGIDHQEASSSISANNTITAAGEALYHAAEEILLTNDFDALNGSVFRAYIADCSGSFVKSASTIINGNEREIITFTEGQSIKPVTENAFHNNMSLIPNPNDGKFIVQFDREVSGKLEVYNSRNILVFNISFDSSTELPIDIQHNSPGMYFVKVITASEILTQKVFKK